MPFDGQPTDYAPATVMPEWATVTGLRDWIAAQDLEAKYCFANAGQCLITKWHEAHGAKKLSASTYSSGIFLWSSTQIDTAWTIIAQGFPRTYQGALDRCNALIKEGAA